MSESSYWDRITRERLGRRRLLKSGAALSMGAAALALVGCGDDDDDDGGGAASPTAATGGSPAPGATTAPTVPAATGGPKVGGKIGYSNTGAGDVSLNPVTNAGQGRNYNGNLVYDQMFSARVGNKAPYQLEAAEGIEQPDDVTVIFTLRPGLVYQDLPPVNGRAVLADDIKAMHEYVRDESRANRSFQTQSMDSVEATDDRTVVFHLKRPNAYLLSATQLGDMTNGYLLPKEIIPDLDTHQAIGSGPYINEVAELGARFTYRRNPTYWRADKNLPYIDEREGFPFGDDVAEESAFRANQTDIFYNVPAALQDKLLSDLSSDVYKVEYPTLSPWTYNIGGRNDFNKLKADVRAREAFYRTMNRQQYIDLVFDGKGTLPTSILTEGHSLYQLTYEESAEYLDSPDLTKARQLLEAAEVLDQEWEIMYFSPNALSDQGSQILQQQMNEVGLKTFIGPIPGAEGFVKATAGEWHLFVGGHPAYGSPQIPMRQQHTESGSRFGYTGLGDPEIDELVEKAEVATDFEEHVNFVKQAQLVSLQKFTGYVLILSQIRNDLLYNRVQDFDFDPASTHIPLTETWVDDA